MPARTRTRQSAIKGRIVEACFLQNAADVRLVRLAELDALARTLTRHHAEGNDLKPRRRRWRQVVATAPPGGSMFVAAARASAAAWPATSRDFAEWTRYRVGRREAELAFSAFCFLSGVIEEGIHPDAAPKAVAWAARYLSAGARSSTARYMAAETIARHAAPLDAVRIAARLLSSEVRTARSAGAMVLGSSWFRRRIGPVERQLVEIALHMARR
jgi:hypothetical protein